MSKEQEASGDELVHPVYLDVPMLISFLAALEGGVSLEDQSTSRASHTSGSEKEARGRAGLPSVLTMLNLDMSGRLSARSEDEAAEEVVAVRRHTEASLFNRLRARLTDLGAVTDVTSADSLADIVPGALVEVRGEVVGNPLLQMLRLIVATAPFAGVEIDALLEGKYEKGGKARGKQGAQQATPPPIDRESAEGLRTFLTMSGELLNSPVRDVVMKSEGGLSTVMTLAASFVEDSTDDYLYESEVRLLGKLTRTIEADGEPINLTRRSTMGLLPQDDIEELVESARQGFGEDLNVSISDALVEAPAIQVLPLAIFV